MLINSVHSFSFTSESPVVKKKNLFYFILNLEKFISSFDSLMS